MPSHRVVFGDSQSMPELPDESVHLVVTSPPYWQVKDYNHPLQIGHEQAYEQYLADLSNVLRECHRVLCPGCRAAVNIGDQYLRAKEYGRYCVKPIPADLIRAGIAMRFDFMGNIIWQKISTTNTTGGCSLMGSMYYPKDGHVTYEHEYIILFRKQGKWPKPTEEQKEKSRLTKEQRSEWFRGMWRIPPERQSLHPAMFPLELPTRLIRMYSFVGETVLDPFLGSATTTLAASQQDRHSIGYEINPAFRSAMEQRLGLADRQLFGQVDVAFETREADYEGVGQLRRNPG